jgi:hypothetical protein
VSDVPTEVAKTPLFPLPQAVGCSTVSSAHHFNSSRVRIAGGVARTRAALSTPTAVPRPLDRPLDSPTVSAAAAASASAAERRASSWYLLACSAVQCSTVFGVSAGAVCCKACEQTCASISVLQLCDCHDSNELKRSTKLYHYLDVVVTASFLILLYLAHDTACGYYNVRHLTRKTLVQLPPYSTTIPVSNATVLVVCGVCSTCS